MTPPRLRLLEDDDPHRYVRPAHVPQPGDATLLAILRGPRPALGQIAAHFDALERALGDAFRALPGDELRVLSRRLDHAHPDDPVAAAFAGLVGDRRARLRARLTATLRRAPLVVAVARAA